MCVDRILLVAGIPSGYVPAVRECVLLSQALQLGGFDALLNGPNRLAMDGFGDIRVDEIDGELVAVDAAHVHAWLLAPTLTDLVVDLARKRGRAAIRVRRVVATSELQIVTALAKRYGGDAVVSEVNGDTSEYGGALVAMTSASRTRSIEQSDPLLHAAIDDGFDVDELLWRSVHSMSNRALAPDSVVSRRHAGPVILQDDGTILGRRPSDDDFDVNMLRKVAPTEAGSSQCS